SSGFIMATAHGADDSDLDHWASLAQSGLTLALYMGKSVVSEVAGRLVAHGASPALPVGIVVNAGRSTKSTYSGNLRSLIEGDVTLAEGPAIIFVGEAVAAGDWADAATLQAQSFKVVA
ncbi:MAG TPA: uroporphyrinogen-III C-methyltransferase, partial [Devosia sp.]|nr:uroporphyrinogen-III C-methyltransferase [Devosia sp.]